VNNNIRSLDEYGNAQQLQYAMNAANRNGRRIVILTNMPSVSTSASSSVWIISPIITYQSQKSLRKFPFVRCRRHRTVTGNNETSLLSLQSAANSVTRIPLSSSSSSLLLHPISKSTSSYMIATGIGGDIHYLIQQLRIYYKYNYERYNNCMGIVSSSSSTTTTTTAPAAIVTPKVTSILQLLLRQFWDYPNVPNDNDDNDDSSTWIPTGYRQLLQDQSDLITSWGRPFGICGIVLQWHTKQQQYIITDQFDPTGIVVQPPTTVILRDEGRDRVEKCTQRRIVCLGPQNELINEEIMKIVELRHRYNQMSSSGNSSNDKERCHNGIHTAEEEDDDNYDSNTTMLLEQEIISAMERVIQNHTSSSITYSNNNNNNNNNNDLPPQQYQIEILNPPPTASTTTSLTVQHDIRIIQRKNY
jgi:hypothetical protein